MGSALVWRTFSRVAAACRGALTGGLRFSACDALCGLQTGPRVSRSRLRPGSAGDERGAGLSEVKPLNDSDSWD